MSHKCSICAIVFNQWFLYQMHLEFDHKFHQPPAKISVAKRRYTKHEKDSLVAKGERRLGTHNFIGG